MTLTTVTDYLGAETGIIALLESALRPAWPRIQVLSADDVEGVEESNRPAPAVYVVQGGERVEASQTGSQSDITQLWVCFAVDNVPRRRIDAGVDRGAVGRLALDSVLALIGQSPGTGYSNLRQAATPFRAKRRGARLYLPLGFTTTFLLRKP